MHEVLVANAGEGAAVDLCSGCGGVFFDFFDGEPSDLSNLLVKDRRPAARRPPVEAECAACGVPMLPHRYLEDGPLVFRCGACLGLFATSDNLRALAGYSSSPEERRSALAEAAQRILVAVREFLA